MCALVTGVQTCALPIFGESGEHDHSSSTSPSFGQPQVFCEAPLTARCAPQPQTPPQKGETRLERLHHQSTAFRRPSILGATSPVAAMLSIPMEGMYLAASPCTRGLVSISTR